jgi:signal transduction histidine kinase
MGGGLREAFALSYSLGSSRVEYPRAMTVGSVGLSLLCVTANNPKWGRHPSFPPSGPGFLLPLVVGVITVVGTRFASLGQPEHADLDVRGILLLVAGPIALLLRRRHPVAVLAFVLMTTLGYLLLDYPRGPIFLALIVAFVSAVMSGHRVAASIALVVGYFSFLWLPYLLGVEQAPGLAASLALGAWLLVLLTVAEVARGRREQAIESARARDEEQRRRASEERLQIARELHDVLAHNISLINVQAGVALHLIDERPEQARTALAAIKDASNAALNELRSVLDVLRRGHEDPPRAPTSGLARIDDLVSRTQAAGLAVKKHVEGDPRPLPAEVDLAAFRIVQEALTNVTRHARGASATVRIGFEKNALTVQIDDDGRGMPATSSGGGRGIRGMSERAAALGGEVKAGPRDGGGFRVVARLPLQEDGSKESG